MEPSRDTVLVTTRNMVDAPVGDGAVILQLQNGQYYGLDEVGVRIWNLLKTPVTVGEIEAVLLAEYDGDPEECHREVVRLVSELMQEGLVEVQE
jgi:hypothetical protein